MACWSSSRSLYNSARRHASSRRRHAPGRHPLPLPSKPHPRRNLLRHRRVLRSRHTLPHMLPTPEDFSRSTSALGVGDDMTIVVYEQQGVFSAPRAWWMLRTFGAQRVYILDGGLRAWTDSGLPIESGPVHRAPASFHAALHRDAVVDLSQLKDRLIRHQQILDARSAARFNGIAPEPRPGLAPATCPEPPISPSPNSSKTAASNQQRSSANTSPPKTSTCDNRSQPPAALASQPQSSHSASKLSAPPT